MEDKKEIAEEASPSKMPSSDGFKHRRMKTFTMNKSKSFYSVTEGDDTLEIESLSVPRRLKRSNSVGDPRELQYKTQTEKKQSNILLALMGDKPLSEDTISCGVSSSEDSLSE